MVGQHAPESTTKNGLFGGSNNLAGIDIAGLLPDLEIFSNSNNTRFAKVEGIFPENASVKQIQYIK